MQQIQLQNMLSMNQAWQAMSGTQSAMPPSLQQQQQMLQEDSYQPQSTQEDAIPPGIAKFQFPSFPSDESPRQNEVPEGLDWDANSSNLKLADGWGVEDILSND